MTVFTVEAQPVGRAWLLSVPEVGRSTQARNARLIPAMAKDLISIMTGLAQTDVEINVVYCLPPKVKAHLDAAAQARQVEAEARSRAAAEQRAAARVLREEQDLTLADIGAVLGVTHQRAHQLTTA